MNGEITLDLQQLLSASLTAPVYEVAIKSALQPMPIISERLGCDVLIKREDTQPVYSYKLRGAYNKLVHLSDEEFEKHIRTKLSTIVMITFTNKAAGELALRISKNILP